MWGSNPQGEDGTGVIRPAAFIIRFTFHILSPVWNTFPDRDGPEQDWWARRDLNPQRSLIEIGFTIRRNTTVVAAYSVKKTGGVLTHRPSVPCSE